MFFSASPSESAVMMEEPHARQTGGVVVLVLIRIIGEAWPPDGEPSIASEVRFLAQRIQSLSVEHVQPATRHVPSGKTERRRVNDHFGQTLNFAGSVYVVGHGQQHRSHGVAERKAGVMAAAVDANRLP